MACENILAEPSPQPKNSVVLHVSLPPNHSPTCAKSKGQTSKAHDAEAEMTHSAQPEGLFVSTPPRHEAFPRI
ncbi:hypothetical protein FIBSPDRAFT_869636 [Athelia psychrophila]|uniref:Uncharacterized protein n=1 Tax=Athelia psychrophila TaxID=1759441 RepID=A0A166C0U6_9AGAM|nr:hypothetical protein FIBSPDRAFT_869636 [Fibularhizoctonia sp. CBS 109695]